MVIVFKDVVISTSPDVPSFQTKVGHVILSLVVYVRFMLCSA
jgi:hypothetical protein